MKNLVFAFILCLLLTIPCGAAIITVDADATGNNDGSSWADAYNYLQDALAAAYSGDEIRVAQGTYKPDQGALITPGDRNATFQLINGVTLKGGYAGFGEPDPNSRDIKEYETILNGDLNGDDIKLTNPADMWGEQSRRNNSEHVVTGSYMDANAILDGFTITAGYNSGLGAGMYNRDSNPTVTNCTFTWNCAEWGGGMGNWNSSPKVIDCKFVSNAAMGGGGIDNMENSTPILINCTFSGNSGFWRGGGILNGYAGVGGSANPILINCIFSGNSTDRYGGGMYNEYSSPIITNCTFTGNTAEWGGGMCNTNSSPTLTNCTFAGNSASNGNALACNSYDRPSNLQLINCILWYGGNGNCNNDNSTITITYSDVQGGWEGIGNIDADPCFVEPEYLGLLAYWKFDEGSGTIAYDSAGDNDGMLVNRPTWTTGQIGGGLNFNGNDGVYVEGSYGTDSPLNIYNSDVTISAWVKLKGPGGTIVARAKPHYITYRLMTWSTTACISVYAPGHHLICSDAILNQDIWYHMVGVFDRASNTGYLYVDGILEADGSMPDAPPGNNGFTKIGCRNNVYDYPFNGTIDEVMIFNRALSGEEIQQLYQDGLN